ncbi:dnaJ homolog subfamily C member 30, mitochondrial-like isoform X1 [Panulirus ornatus]|uniref:dnaJ homolog subfamily C member 30, mitochondrial-like isoform X1 n=1 Tax=Panulirus ornatus TaxID=150431 RepID=UPI003A89B29B
MVQVIFGNNIKSTLITFTRKYSVCRALIGNSRYSRNEFLRITRSSTCYELIIGISSKKKNIEYKKNYYDVLQLTPKATQAQVKSAYYKLSKTYHPDQSKGKEDTSVRFREITEAYEILGNFHKRKMYDKGLLNISTAASPAEAEEYASKFYESRSRRSRAPTAAGRTPIFDFDEWTKLHYESSRERRGHAKIRYERMVKYKEDASEEKKSNVIISIVFLGVVLYGFQFCSQQNVDSSKSENK